MGMNPVKSNGSKNHNKQTKIRRPPTAVPERNKHVPGMSIKCQPRKSDMKKLDGQWVPQILKDPRPIVSMYGISTSICLNLYGKSAGKNQ